MTNGAARAFLQLGRPMPMNSLPDRLETMISDPYRRMTENASLWLAQGALERAKTAFLDILRLDPERPDAWHGLARIAYERGHHATAIAMAGRALRGVTISDHQRARYLITLGAALLGRVQGEAARATFATAIRLNVSASAAWLGLADSLVMLKRPADAMQTLEHAARCASETALVLTRLATLRLQEGAWDDAIAAFRQVVARRPTDGGAWANLGAALFQGYGPCPGRLEEAVDALKHAIMYGSRTAATLNTRGLTRMALGHLSAARSDLQEAASLDPDNVEIVNNLATVLDEYGEYTAAEVLYDDLVSRGTGVVRSRSQFNRGTLLLGQGRYAQGWHDFEARCQLMPPVPGNYLPGKYLPEQHEQGAGIQGRNGYGNDWDGTVGEAPLNVIAEQGLGDQVQFMRFLPLAAARRPLRLCGPFSALARFMPDLEQTRLIPDGKKATSFVRLLSLPKVLGEHTPQCRPYIRSPAVPEKRTVGFCWSGGPAYRFDRRRSVAIDSMAPLLDIPGLKPVALQRGPVPAGMERVPLDTLEDLLCAVGRCALVISVDTLVAHMAGATGRPLWLLNRYGGD